MKQLTLNEVERIFSSPLTWDNLPPTAKEKSDLGLLLINNNSNTFTILLGRFTLATKYDKDYTREKLLHCTAYYRPMLLDDVNKKGKFHIHLSKDDKLSIFTIGDVVKIAYQEMSLVARESYDAEKPLTIIEASVSGVAIARRGDLLNVIYTLSIGAHFIVLYEDELIDSKVLAEQMEARFNETKM